MCVLNQHQPFLLYIITISYCTQVALQFPDELLVDCVAVAAALERETKAKTYILGDTTYGR